MNILCPHNQPCIDDANSLGNYSSELPDEQLFRSTYFPNEIWDDDFDIWYACFGLCVSTVSQAEADLCAQNNAKICEQNKQHGNAEQTCSRTCPDGNVYSYTIPENTFYAETQAQANALAADWCSKYLTDLCANIVDPTHNPVRMLPPPYKRPACNDPQVDEVPCPDGGRGAQVPACYVYGANKEDANARARGVLDDFITENLGCLTEFPRTVCLNEDIGTQFVVPTKVGVLKAPYTWDVFGVVPAGLTFTPMGLAMKITGVFGYRADFAFRLTLTDFYGRFLYRNYGVSVMEIDEPAVLPDATQDSFYSHAISTAGGTNPKTFSVPIGYVLPSGLSLNASTGVISGEPDSYGTTSFKIRVVDKYNGTCEKDFTLTILPNIFGAWTWTLSPTPGGCGVATATGAGSSGTMDCSIPGTPVVCGSASASVSHGVWTANNTTGAPLNAQLRVEVQKVRLCPPDTNGIQSGSETIFFRETFGAVIANTGSGAVAAGTYTFPFVIPVGITSYQGLFICQAGYSGVPFFLGGSSHFQIYFELP